MYHDANGYLVIKRKFGERPDYKFPKVNRDRLNANTYPVTSFAYLTDGKSKLVLGVDRAQGVSLDGPSALLANIDRLAG